MKKCCLTNKSPINVERALETLYDAVPDSDVETKAAYYVLKEFIGVVKEGVNEVPVLLRKK